MESIAENASVITNLPCIPPSEMYEMETGAEIMWQPSLNEAASSSAEVLVELQRSWPGFPPSVKTLPEYCSDMAADGVHSASAPSTAVHSSRIAIRIVLIMPPPTYTQ